jgi:hypothetical protein
MANITSITVGLPSTDIERSGYVLRVGVDDIEAQCALLRQRGVEVGLITEFPISEGAATIAPCYLDDPDGNKICLYQAKALP